MNYLLFAFRDNKLSLFLPPWASPNKAVAIRSVVQSLKGGDSDLCKFPGDFNLFMIGDYDAESGAVSAVAPENMGLVSQYVEE